MRRWCGSSDDAQAMNRFCASARKRLRSASYDSRVLGAWRRRMRPPASFRASLVMGITTRMSPRPRLAIWSPTALRTAFLARGVMLRLVSMISTVATGA